MDVKKVYVVSHGRRDGSFFAYNEIEEYSEDDVDYEFYNMDEYDLE